MAEAAGVGLWCQDEAGPYQAVPQPGASWQPEGCPARQPHGYVRGGTAKLLTLFRPATGAIRAKGVTSAANAGLHPWLQEELTQVLAALPKVTVPETERPHAAQWATWLGHEPREPRPPRRRSLSWDNLAGHLSRPGGRWLAQHGVMPLDTPLSGAWLNMAGVAAAHPRGAGAGGPAPADGARDHCLAGGDSGRVESGSDPLRPGRQTP